MDRDNPSIKDWGLQEIEEFEREVATMATRLGYRYKVSELPVYKPKIPTVQEKIKKDFSDIKKATKRALKKVG